MQQRALGRTGLTIGPMVLGGNVFGWTADEKTSFDILDAFVGAGLNAIDTADVYSAWAPGHRGGESETVIGKWFASRPGSRSKVVLVTKVGALPGTTRRNLSAQWITQAVEASLKRLQTDYIDLYLSHWPDADTPYEETLRAFDSLLKAGKVRAVGTSNLDAAQLATSLEAAQVAGVHRYDVLQPEYNLYARQQFEGELREIVTREEIGVISYYALAAGFLTGKYRSTADLGKSPRGGGMRRYLDERGLRILSALDEVSDSLGATPAEVALAWVIAASGVTAPIASATSLSQLASLLRATQLRLSAEHLSLLDKASS